MTDEARPPRWFRSTARSRSSARRPLRPRGRSAGLPRRARLAPRLPALLGRLARRRRRVSHRERRALLRDARLQPPRVERRTRAGRRRPSAGRRSAATSPTSRGSRRRRRRRSTSGSATSCTASHSASRSACSGRSCTCPKRSRGEHDLLDLAARRPRLGRVEPLDRRPRIRLRQRARPSELGIRWGAAAALGRRRWRRWRWWRRVRLSHRHRPIGAGQASHVSKAIWCRSRTWHAERMSDAHGTTRCVPASSAE